MKNFVYLFAAGTMILAACSSEPAYKISGTIEGVADGEYVYLQEAKGRELVKLDSAVVTNGAFTFNGRQDVAVNRYIAYTPAEGKRKMADFFLENGNIIVTFGEETTVAGTPNNEIYQAYKKEAGVLNKEMRALYEKSKAEDAKAYVSEDADAEDITLAEMLQLAIGYFGEEDPFFIMCEGGDIDWESHSNFTIPMIEKVISFDNAIAVAYEFYKQHPKRPS